MAPSIIILNTYSVKGIFYHNVAYVSRYYVSHVVILGNFLCILNRDVTRALIGCIFVYMGSLRQISFEICFH